MYQTLLFTHSIFRWLVVGSLVFTVTRSAQGYFQQLTFSKRDNLWRHWTATIAHIQLVLGIMLYTQSPIILFYWKNFSTERYTIDYAFYGFVHFFLMFVAIILITIGSALAKRKSSDKEKFKTILIWLSLALILIFIAIPWPFSPLSNRPYIRFL